jgi:hypothetical protein
VELAYRFPSSGFCQKPKGNGMNAPTIQSQPQPLEPQLSLSAATVAPQPRKKILPAEPENFGALPEDQRLMPENEPEKNLKIQVYDEGNCVYDEGEPGPFGWKPRSPLDRLSATIQEDILDLMNFSSLSPARARR